MSRRKNTVNKGDLAPRKIKAPFAQTVFKALVTASSKKQNSVEQHKS